MQSYEYSTRTGTQGQVTTARDPRGIKTNAEVYAEIQARLGAQALTIPLVLKTFMEVTLDWMTEGYTIDPIDDLLGCFLPCGGSFPDLNFQPTFEGMNHHPAAIWGDTGKARVAGNITYHNTGHQGRVVPIIIDITDIWTNRGDAYTAGKSVLLDMAALKSKVEFDRARGCKVQFRKSDNSLLEASDYGTFSPTKFTAQVPAAMSGSIVEVIITVLINGTLRSGSYTTVLAP